MGQDLIDHEFDHSVRQNLLKSFDLASDLHRKLLLTPPGQFGDAQNTQIRSNFAISVVKIVSAFNDSIKILLSDPSPSLDRLCIANLTPRKRGFSADNCRKVACGTADSLLSTSRNADTPPLSPTGLPAPITKHFSPSPPRSSNNSPPSEMSDGSPSTIPRIEHDKDVTKPEIRAGRTNEAAETAENDAAARENPSRKRKLLPKISLKMPASNLDQGSETPPDDGHTWRKYGQKDILGARYPRSYYRCTHKTDLGCQAIKQVQRCEEDSSMFDVTYRGHHTCRSAQLDNQMWPFAFPHPLPHMVMQRLPGSQSNLPPIFTRDMVIPAFSSSPRAYLPSIQQPNLLPFPNPNSSQDSPINSASLTLRPASETLANVGAATPKFAAGLGQDGYSNPLRFISSDYFNLNSGRTDLSSLLLQQRQARSIRQKLSEDHGPKTAATDGISFELRTDLMSPEVKQSTSSEKEQQPQPPLQQSESGRQQQQMIFSSSQDWSLAIEGRDSRANASMQQATTTQVESSAQEDGSVQIAESIPSQELPASSAFMVELLEESPLNWTFDMDCDTMADRL